MVRGPQQSTPRQQCRTRPAPMTTPRVRLAASEQQAVHANTVNVAHVKPMRRSGQLVDGVLQPLKKRRLLWQGGRLDRGDQGQCVRPLVRSTSVQFAAHDAGDARGRLATPDGVAKHAHATGPQLCGRRPQRVVHARPLLAAHRQPQRLVITP